MTVADVIIAGVALFVALLSVLLTARRASKNNPTW